MPSVVMIDVLILSVVLTISGMAIFVLAAPSAIRFHYFL